MPRARLRLTLFVLLLGIGGVITLVHDYAYRRGDTGDGDYELGGLMTHAGVDMLLITFILAVSGALWENRDLWR